MLPLLVPGAPDTVTVSTCDVPAVPAEPTVEFVDKGAAVNPVHESLSVAIFKFGSSAAATVLLSTMSAPDPDTVYNAVIAPSPLRAERKWPATKDALSPPTTSTERTSFKPPEPVTVTFAFPADEPPEIVLTLSPLLTPPQV